MNRFFQSFFSKARPQSKARSHRPFNQSELEACRRVDGSKFAHFLNPGIRVEANYVSEEDAAKLVECANILKMSHGFTSSDAQDVLAVDGNRHVKLDFKISSLRVTGRPELPTQNHAPWGYGDTFKIDSVPEVLLKIAKKIENDDNFGSLQRQSLRDITINYRTHSMFKLDPHCDPVSDGQNVFILGLQSDVVLTFTPPNAVEGGRLALEAGFMDSGGTVRTAADAIAMRSWTDHDIDVLLKMNSLVHFTGPAKSIWRHAIRIGVDADKPYNGICDWFGSVDTLIKRNPDRISIVFAFQ